MKSWATLRGEDGEMWITVRKPGGAQWQEIIIRQDCHFGGARIQRIMEYVPTPQFVYCQDDIEYAENTPATSQ